MVCDDVGATWQRELPRLHIPPLGHLRKESIRIKNFGQTSGLLDEVEGIVQGHRDGHGFVSRDDGAPDIYLPPNEMRAVLHKDRVKVRIVRSDRKGRPEGRVVEILERSKQPIIGRLLQESGVWLVAPEDKRYGQDVLIPKGATSVAKPGQVVVVELVEPPALFGQPVGRIKEVLGEVDDPGMEIEIAVRKFSVPHEFSEACIALARTLPDKVRPQDTSDRIDLTDVPLVTIDGEDARDFDDAVYCEPATKGRGKSAIKGWRLLVAIADVSHYVENGSAIDIDAYDRATSVYFPRRVIPMLPEKLSNGLCSLNPEVERLCMVCDMFVTADGEVNAYQFYPAVMWSHARFTYTEVAAILGNTRGPEAIKRKDRVQDLLNLHGVFQALLKSRQKRGAVDFETTETQIVCDENGRIEKIVPRTRNVAHRVIEEAMLAANVCSADFIAQSKHPGLFRVHEGPTPEKKEILQNYLKVTGLGMTISDDPSPGEFQAIAVAMTIASSLLVFVAVALIILGGKVGFYKGLLDFVDNDDQVAAVLGHEVGHVVLRHAAKRIGQETLTSVVIQGGDEKAKSEVQIKDLIIGAEIAGASGDRDDYLQKQAEAQFAAKESELVEKVSEVLARHNVSWASKN